MDGAPVVIPGAKPRAILTMLGLHGGAVVPADVLTELLWGDDPPRTAAKALQTHISSLRHTLGDGFVLTQGTGWRLNTAETDASRYQSLTKAGRDALGAGDTSTAVTRFDEAATLWRGIPELPDGRRGVSEKTRWIEAHAALVEDRADALLATGRAAEIIGDLEAAVADAPLRERRWGQLMLALYRAGRQGEALGAFKRAQSVLADELGVDPGPDLRRLEAAIVAQDTALEVPAVQSISSSMRAVTFLLTDIEGSTAAWEADAGAMAIALARHDELVEQVVTSRGGRLIKTRGEGDATFSVFDRPSAAASAAIELQDAIFHEPWALAGPMRIRIALHTGEAELRDGDYFGRAVNRAARLRSQASGGQILCSGATAELVIDSLSDDVALVDLGMRQLKNLARPEHIFELRLQTAESPPPAGDSPIERPAIPAVLAGPGPFVGRGRELAELLAAWHQTVIAGTRAVLIAGEPGVGKTRLAGEWCRQAYEQGALVLYGRSDEDLGAPYQPFAEALRTLVPGVGSDRLRGMRGIEALLPLVPGLTDVLPDVAAPPHGDPDTERYALFDAVVALLGIASLDVPIVLVLDDLHWAAKPTLLLLRHLLRFGEHARVQIVGTYRSTDLDRSHPLAAMLADLHRDGSAERIALNGLDEDDVTAYVAEAGYDEELARALASVTGGNPFFLIQALRHVDESGGHWDPSTLPQGVREAVSRRLSRLPLETNKALAAAAVVGSQFALDLVEQVVGQDLVDAFDEACQAGILIEEPGGLYRFNHAIVRQSLLAELASVRRMRLHQRIAAALENLPGAGDELLADLAHHYFECAWAGNAVKAVEYCRRAADQAMARLAYEGAADLYDHALHALDELDDELPDRDDQRVELLVARCEALLAAGDVSSAAGAVSQLKEGTRDSARLAAWATCFDGELSTLVDPESLDEIEAAVGTAAAALAELGDAAGEAKAYTVRAGCLARLGRIGDCEVALDNALTAARRAREHRRVNEVLAGAPLAALWGPNPVPRAGGRCLDVVRLLRITTDSPAVEATSTRCQAVLEAFRGRAAAARRMIDSARRTVTELGLRHAVLEVEHFAGLVELVLDDPTASEQHLRLAYNGLRRMGLDADAAETAALLGRTCLLLDRGDEADELCSESERLAGHALKASITWRTVRAQLLSRRGDHDGARRVAEEAVAIAARTDALIDHGDACLALAVVLDAAGDTVGAQAAAERAAELYDRKGAVALAEKTHRLLGKRPFPNPPAAPAQPETSVEMHTPAVAASERVAELEALHVQFEEERPQVSRLENVASHVYQDIITSYAIRDWDAIRNVLAENISTEDRRRVVNAGRRTGRDAVIAEIVAICEVGVTELRSDVIAIRGRNLVLCRSRAAASRQPQPFHSDLLEIIEVNSDNQISKRFVFDVDDVDAAFEELDARYLAGEAAPYSQVWTAVTDAYAAFNRREIPPTTPDWVNLDHRHTTAMASGEGVAYFHASWELAAELNVRIEVVHRLNKFGAVFTHVGKGRSREGFEAKWRAIVIMTAEGHLINRAELFDEADLDAALEKFDELIRPSRRLQNAASRATDRFLERFAAHDWHAMAQMVIDDISLDDRRRVISADLQIGRDTFIENFRIAADLGATQSPNTVATRGERLLLTRARFSLNGGEPDEFGLDLLHVIEIAADHRIAATVTFDPDDLDAAFEELDARYLAGEAAGRAHTWSAVIGVYAALNRRKLPATTPDHVSLDHRRVTSFAPGDIKEYTRLAWNQMPDISFRIADVHRLTDFGVVVTHALHGTSRDGFEAEWREIHLMTLDGDLFNRSEMFDEADLDSALARLEELSRPVPLLENAASRAYERLQKCFKRADLDALATMLADNFCSEDRRHIVSTGIRRGRDAALEDARAVVGLGVSNTAATVIATRGERLALRRSRYANRDEQVDGFHVEILEIIALGADGLIIDVVTFDSDDFGSAVAELDARYLADEAASHAHTWSTVINAYAALNRHELPAATPDSTNVDHRRLIAIETGALSASLQAIWDTTSQARIYVEAVHQLSDVGVVVAHTASATSQDGLDVEWRNIAILTIEGDLVSRAEAFDEDDLDAALVRFDELNRPRGPRPENTASLVEARCQEYLSAGDLTALSQLMAEDISIDDRRRVINAGRRRGRDVVMEDLRVGAEVGLTQIAPAAIATRGEHLTLRRIRYSGEDQRPEAFLIDLVQIVEIDANQRICALVLFDPDDIDSAFAELEARYVAGEAADHAQTWSAVANGYAALNRHEIPRAAPDLVNVDHRPGVAFMPGDLFPYIHAAWDVSPDLKVHIETAHRLNRVGTVITQAANGSSHHGFDAEWRQIVVFTVDGDAVNRCEMYDESDLDVALARFDELTEQPPRLDNAASRVEECCLDCFAARDWESMNQYLADDFSFDDRRTVVNAGTRYGPDAAIADARAVAELGATRITSDVVATRGERLFLARTQMASGNQGPDVFHTESLCVAEIDTHDRISARVVFDPGNLDAAFEELDARYLAGEAAPHTQTWSTIVSAYAALNRHELPAVAPTWTDIDHRPTVAIATGGLGASLRAIWDITTHATIYVEAVHQLIDVGVVVTHVATATSQEGFDAEWRDICLVTVEGDQLSRAEVFDPADLDAALARFDELTQQPPTSDRR
ncbi:BTAD domain-containing putative transcriptional regulator [Mycolicibacterium sp. XJ766]